MLVSRSGHTSAPEGKPLIGTRMRTNDQLNPNVALLPPEFKPGHLGGSASLPTLTNINFLLTIFCLEKIDVGHSWDG